MKSILVHVKVILGLLMFFPVNANGPRIFENLKQVEQYAATLDEYPEPDNTDLENPDFDTYLHSLVPSWISRQLEGNIGLGRGGWSASGFRQLLQVVVKVRENTGFRGRFVVVMKPKPGERYIIVGELHGAFHSMVRDIRDWVNKGFMNEKFKIIQPDFYIVINGGVVSRSPYILETLTLIARLLYVNPERVIYIRGVHEDKERWKHYGLKKELNILASHISHEKIPLQSLVNRFFETLPLALYLIDGKRDKLLNVVRISNYGRDNKELDEKNFAALIVDSQCTICPINEKKRSEIMIDVRALIRGEQFLKPMNLQEGLVMYGKEEGATSWFLLSSPTKAYRALFQFFYDAYAYLTIYESLDDWTLTLYSQDVRDLQGFNRAKVVKLLSGVEVTDKVVQESRVKVLQQKLQETSKEIDEIKKDLQKIESGAKQPIEKTKVPVQVPAVMPVQPVVPPATSPAVAPAAPLMVVPQAQAAMQQEEKKKKENEQGAVAADTGIAKQESIMLGSSMDLSRSLKNVSQWLKASIEWVFVEANAVGVPANKKIDFVVRDDEYNPSRALENINYFLDVLKTDILLCPLGTPTLLAYTQKVKEDKLLVLFPITGAAQFHSPAYKNIINLRASYVDEGRVLARYALDTLRSKKIVLFYQKDVPDIGGILETFKKANFTNYVEVSYDPQKIESNEQAKRVIAAAPDTVILLAIPQSALALIQALGKEIQNIKTFLCWSILAGDAFQNQAKKGLSIVVSSVVPNPALVANAGQPVKQLPVIQEFQMFAQRNSIPFDVIALEGYLAARVVLYLVSAVQGALTKDNIRTVAENMKDYTGIGGLSLTFNNKTRGLLNKVWLDTGSPEWQEFSTLEEEVAPKK